ncbi:MAG: hypothetical protein M3Z37_10725 [Candidatus Eremiobacteraeota bacterium]|nr:hypothetical protein [Candidatus Eremiobacteraeota bacterium]
MPTKDHIGDQRDLQRSPDFASGDLLLFYRARGRDRVISLVTGSPFFHVALARDARVILEAVPRGVRRRDLRTEPGRHPYLVIPGFADHRAAAVRWAETQVGDGYDSVDIGVIVLHRIFRLFAVNYTIGDRYTCGEFVARAYQEAGKRLFPDIATEDVVPADFKKFLPEPLRNARSSREISAADANSP